MATQAQTDANRANAQKSTGPRTAEGRAAVRQNALKHGLTSMSPVAPGEDPAEFLQFLAGWTQSYLPIGPAEEEVLRTAVVASWRLRRIPAIEAGYYEMERPEIEQGGGQSQSPAARLAFAHYHCSKQIEALSCQEARIQRTFDRSLRELERLQALPARGSKIGLENQTQFPAQPEESKPPYAAASQSSAAPQGELENQTQFAVPQDTAGRVEAEDNRTENQTQFPIQPEDAAVSSPIATQAAVAEVRQPENQTQFAMQPDESDGHTAAAAQSAPVHDSGPENQTQFPAQSDESALSNAVAAESAGPQRPRRLTPRDRQAASDLIARLLARFPKTA